jgi:hypothetical protein
LQYNLACDNLWSELLLLGALLIRDKPARPGAVQPLAGTVFLAIFQQTLHFPEEGSIIDSRNDFRESLDMTTSPFRLC